MNNSFNLCSPIFYIIHSHHALLSTTATETTSPGDGATSTTDATDASKQTSPEVEALQGQMEKLVTDHQDETNALKEKVSDVNVRTPGKEYHGGGGGGGEVRLTS